MVIPALVATGIFHQVAFALTGFSAAEAHRSSAPAPSRWARSLPPGATIANEHSALFSAAVVAQSMHYARVILFLPRLNQHRPGHRAIAAAGGGGRAGTEPSPWGRRRSRRSPSLRLLCRSTTARPLGLRRHGCDPRLIELPILLAWPWRRLHSSA